MVGLVSTGVLYGDYDLIPRRDLWGVLRTLSAGILEEPWLVLGDFNAVIDDSEVCGRAADTSASMADEGTRSLWKRLDRMLVNEAWLEAWPDSSYICALPSTSIILHLSSLAHTETLNMQFRFDNYLARQPGFLELVTNIWQHHIVGTAMYEVVCKLKALKADFRRQRQRKGNLTENVKMAKSLFGGDKTGIRMLKQRAKLRWMKHGDQNSKVFFRKINSARAKQRVFQIMKATGEVLTAHSFHRRSLLDAPVTQSDIKDAFFAIDEDSAPGPDGYTSAFFKSAWPVIGHDISEARIFQNRPSSIQVLRDTLTEFAALSGLNVNPAKSQIILSRAVQQERRQIVEYLGFQEGSLPVRYLGVPLTSSRLTIADCRPLINRIDTRLAGWNQHNLSYAGRVQLIKSVLSSLHTYWASVYSTERILELEEIDKITASVANGVCYKVGNGSSFSLWQDIWHARGPLCLSYPRGPALTGLPISSLLSSVLQQDQWRWPASTEADIAEIISQLPPTNPTTSDQICWRNSAGKFTVQSAILLIQPATMQVQWHGLLRGLNFNGRLEWKQGIIWASKRWRGTHLINVALRSVLASLSLGALRSVWFWKKFLEENPRPDEDPVPVSALVALPVVIPLLPKKAVEGFLA
ncbi:UNVERIFIED_CONTAM: hypothetical protein Scaly_2668800 [Sesamum calycinum]|uniref:Reverse transcriptase n=1 Tax=Sesamum calycinum TaxID=2727403 RepID=A0AAW2J722_9LAMI